MQTLSAYLRRLRGFSRNARLYLLFSFLSGLTFSVYYLFFNLYILSMDYDPGFLGLLVALPMGINLIVAIPAGLLGDRIGYRRAMLGGTALMVLSTVGIALLPSARSLVLFSLASGLGSSLVWVVGAPFMAQNSSEEERTHLFSVQFAVNTFSGFFGYLLGGGLPALFANLFRVGPEEPAAYRATLLLSAGLLAVALLPLLAVRARSAGEPSGERLRLKEAFQEPRLLGRLFFPEVVIGFGAGLLIPYLNVFFKGKFALPDALLGTLFAGQAVAMGLATLAGPLLAERWGKIRAVVFTQLGSIPFLLMLGYSPLLSAAAVGFLARAALMNMGGPLYTAFVMERVEERRRGAVNGLLMMSWSGSWGLSNWVSGQLQQGPGFGLIFLITCVSYLLGSTMTYRFFAKEDRPRPGALLEAEESEEALERLR
ncbi:MAG: MFS transporter [Candidatus Bipolaricaulia bacterium]